MPSTEPSPRPWSVDGIDISDANGEPVTPLYFNEQDEANAALIVDAVNDRDRLRDIVRRMADTLEHVSNEHRFDFYELVREARAAIGEAAP